MPDRQQHLKFDTLLKTQEIVSDKDYSLVHDWMDNLFVSENPQSLDINLDRIDTIKKCVAEKCGEVDEQVLTDYFRVALGHLVLEAIQNNFVFKNEYEFMKRSLQVYLDKDYCNYCF
jgi:hypothetical protein